MTHYRVRLAEEAEQDLIDIHDYVAAHDTRGHADSLLDKLETLCAELAQQPHRGHIPPELDRIGVTTYREVHFKPYRLIYEITGRDVFVHCRRAARYALAARATIDTLMAPPGT